MFRRRLCSAFLLTGALVISALQTEGMTAVFALVIATLLGVTATREYLEMLERKGIRVFKVYGAIIALIFLPAVFLIHYFPSLDVTLEHFITFVLVCGLFIVQAFERNPHRALGNISGTLSCFIYIPWLWSYLFKVLYFPRADGRWFVLALFLIVKGGDMLAYVVGSACGRHKLIPRISPGKTWEGSAANCAGGLIAGLIVWKWFPCDFSLHGALILAAILNIAGQVGDLAASMLKRDAEIKDSSRLIPGIGGSLDILDSLLLSLPTLYFYLLFFR